MFWLGLAIATCYVPGWTGAFIATQWALLACVLPLFLLRSGPVTRFHVAGLLFVAYAVVAALFGVNPQASVFGLWTLATAALCLWFGSVATDTEKLYAGMATGAAVSSVIAVFQYFGTPVVPSVSATPAGLFVNGVQLGVVLALLVVVLYAKRMWLYALPLLPGIVVAQSRGTFLALGVGLLACHVRRLWVFGILATAGAFYLLTPLSGSDTQRMLIWSVALQNLTLTGWGAGSFYTLLLSDGNGPFYPEYAHNDAIQLAFEYGVAALIPFALFGFALRRTDATQWPVVVAFVAASCYSMPLHMPVAAFLGLAAVGSVLRNHGVAVSDSRYGGQPFISWPYSSGRQAVSMASNHSTEG